MNPLLQAARNFTTHIHVGSALRAALRQNASKSWSRYGARNARSESSGLSTSKIAHPSRPFTRMKFIVTAASLVIERHGDIGLVEWLVQDG